MMCCFSERPLSKTNVRWRIVPEKSTSVLLREIVCGCGKVVLMEDDNGKRTATICLHGVDTDKGFTSRVNPQSDLEINIT